MNGVGSFLPVDVDLGGMAHEVGHGLSFNHSFSDDPTYRNATWAQIGEYDDPWDVMSWANAWGHATTQFGFAPPGTNGFHTDRMGWLAKDQVMTFGADGVGSRAVTLKPLHDSGSGIKLVRVPFDPGDLFHYYTVEFRMPSGWDSGIPANIVLLHEVNKGVRDPNDQSISYLLRARTSSRDPIQTLNANGVSIQVTSVNAAARQATVTISSDIVNRVSKASCGAKPGPPTMSASPGKYAIQPARIMRKPPPAAIPSADLSAPTHAVKVSSGARLIRTITFVSRSTCEPAALKKTRKPPPASIPRGSPMVRTRVNKVSYGATPIRGTTFASPATSAPRPARITRKPLRAAIPAVAHSAPTRAVKASCGAKLSRTITSA
jgi:hypothetical protein